MTLNRREILTAGCLSLLAVGIGAFPKRAVARTTALPPKIYVDAHRHLLPREFGGNPEEDLDKTLAWMDRYGVMQAILLGAYSVGPGEEANLGQAEMVLGRISSYGDLFFPFCSIAPETIYSQSELVEVLAQLKKLGVIGLGEFKTRGLHIDDPKCMAIYAACAEVGLPVLFHIDDTHCIDDPGLPRAGKGLANQYGPDVHRAWPGLVGVDLGRRDDARGT